jgi:hypothetical protein
VRTFPGQSALSGPISPRPTPRRQRHVRQRSDNRQPGAAPAARFPLQRRHARAAAAAGDHGQGPVTPPPAARRVSRLPVGGVIAATAIAVGLSEALSPPPTLGTIRTAAYTLRHNQNGTDTLTLNPGELFDPAQLQSDLTKYGIPARVTTGSYCTSDPQPAGFTQVVSGPGPGTWQAGSSQAPALTIDPSQMPSDTELSVGHFQLPTGEQQANMNLINTNSYTCTSTPPTLGPGTPGLGVLYGGHTAS